MANSTQKEVEGLLKVTQTYNTSIANTIQTVSIIGLQWLESDSDLQYKYIATIQTVSIIGLYSGFLLTAP